MQIGYVGLGAMGGALATRLLSEHKLTVWDLDSSKLREFERRGASIASDAAALARDCDIVLLCLPKSADVRRVVFGPNGLSAGLSAGTILVDQTSGMPSETRTIASELQKRGVEMIDAPVSGGVAGAANGTISIMVSGPESAYQRALPALNTISKSIFRCGESVGDAQAMKLVNNVLSAGCRIATLEIVAMGRKMGLPLAAMTDVINKGSGRNRTSKLFLKNLVDGKPSSSSFAMSLMLKDMNQAIALGMECGAPTPITSIVRGLLQIGVSQLGEQAQLEEIIGLLESMARTKIADEAAQPTEQPAAVGDGSELRVGYVGLGAMGGALTRRLLLSRKMQIFDANADVVSSFVNEQATAADSLASLARACDVIFVCLPTSSIVAEAIFGKGGLAEGLAPGKIVVDQTTGDPTVTREISARLQEIGVSLVDAPVSGGPRGAVAGTIALICGGPTDAYARVRPILESISPNTVYCGETGNGHVAKLIQNAVASCNRLLTYEAAALGVKYGLKLSDMATVVNTSTGWSGASERILPTLSEGKPTADFQLQLMAKDLKLAARMAAECGAPMLVASEVRCKFEAGAHEFGATANLDQMARMFEKAADIKFAGA